MAKLNDDARRLVDARTIAHLATLLEDGQPKVEPVWIGRDGDRIVITTDRKSIKARNIARDPRVALSMTDPQNPYRQLLIRGVVVEERDDNDLVEMDKLSMKYLGQPFPRRRWSSRVAFFVEPTIARYYESPLADLVVDGRADNDSEADQRATKEQTG